MINVTIIRDAGPGESLVCNRGIVRPGSKSTAERDI